MRPFTRLPWVALGLCLIKGKPCIIADTFQIYFAGIIIELYSIN
jgi:hypothetical protein